MTDSAITVPAATTLAAQLLHVPASNISIERMATGTSTSHDGWLDAEHAVLAHGDFDAMHIFQQNGLYTGIIDFGEIRGADRWYDLGHFHLHDDESLALPVLLQGYNEITPLPPNAEERILFASLLIAVRALSRSLQKRAANHYTPRLLQTLRVDIAALA